MSAAGARRRDRGTSPSPNGERRSWIAGILIVDDHQLFADAIRAALVRHHYEVSEPVGTAAEAVTAAELQQPDVALVDIGLPDESGVQVGRRIMEVSPQTRVVAVTAMDDQRLADEIVRAGFRGYLLKDTKVSQLLSAIQVVLGGEVVFPRRLARPARATAASRRPACWASSSPPGAGGPRDARPGGREIARNLGVAPNTVRTHVQSILSKLQVHSRLEAAALAVRPGLIRPAPPR